MTKRIVALWNPRSVPVTATLLSVVVVLSCTIVVSNAATPVAISIDFVGSATAMAATESAGVVAKSNWNSVTGVSQTIPLALKDEAGVTTGATLTWSADNVGSTPIVDQPGNRRLMKGYLDQDFKKPTMVTVAGLPIA
jgi:hypothetical protein